MAGSAKRRPYAFLCGTPKEFCSGAQTPLNAMLRSGSGKTHFSPEQAFGCHKAYLINVMKYSPGEDGRSLIAPLRPDGTRGEVRILTKPSRFGAKMRNGKEGTRNMPHIRGHHGGARGGTIISS